MPYRYTNIRIVDPANGIHTIEYQPFSLWRVAYAAAEETVQGAPLTSAWLRLFSAHLSRLETTKLRWRGDLAESAEMRQVYSAMYGRYFSRALLASRFDITDFVPLYGNITRIANGVTVHRISSGDIPDWIAWDPVHRCYVLAEAKGRLTGSVGNFLTQMPACIGSGKAQFSRVAVRNSRKQKIRTRNWVVGNLWSTDERIREPVSLLWDPDGEGEELSDDEIPRHARALRAHRMANIAAGLGRPGAIREAAASLGLALKIAIEPSKDIIPYEDTGPSEIILSPEDLTPRDRTAYYERRLGPVRIERRLLEPIEKPASDAHEDVYAAALITPLGVRPILDSADLDAAKRIQARARDGDHTAMIYGLSIRAMEGENKRALWLSANGIVSPDGAGLFNLKDVNVSEA